MLPHAQKVTIKSRRATGPFPLLMPLGPLTSKAGFFFYPILHNFKKPNLKKNAFYLKEPIYSIEFRWTEGIKTALLTFLAEVCHRWDMGLLGEGTSK